MAENPSPEPTLADEQQARPSYALPSVVATEGSRPPFNELSVLFPLLSLYTAGYLALMLADFLLKQSLDLPEGIMPLYIALLGAYAADKEVRRWLVTPEPPRKGSIFVYFWMLFFLGAFIVRTFQPEYVLPDNLSAVCLQVLGIFFGSRASKYLYQGRTAVPSGVNEATLALIREQGSVSRKQIEEKFGISERSANRLLAGLETEGLIRREGEGKGIRYVPVSPSRP